MENGKWKMENGEMEDGKMKDGKMENGEWRNGEWRMEKWRMENGEWRNGEWKMENGEWKNGGWKNGKWRNGEMENGEDSFDWILTAWRISAVKARLFKRCMLSAFTSDCVRSMEPEKNNNVLSLREIIVLLQLGGKKNKRSFAGGHNNRSISSKYGLLQSSCSAGFSFPADRQQPNGCSAGTLDLHWQPEYEGTLGRHPMQILHCFNHVDPVGQEGGVGRQAESTLAVVDRAGLHADHSDGKTHGLRMTRK